jgi:hypothetical protein
VYKGKAAAQFRCIAPTVKVAGAVEITKKGCMIVDVALAAGSRTYDWANKISFALSVTELSQLFLANTLLSGGNVNLFHDPNMMKQTQGQV